MNMKTEKIEALDKEIIDYIDKCNKYDYSKSYLIAVLHKVQSKYGYLSKEHMEEVAQRLNIPTAKVSGVATFYHFFRLSPRGKYTVAVCMGTACFVKGADKVLDTFKKELGVDFGEVTHDGLFSIENSRCVGVCALAPVVMINDEVYNNVNAGDVVKIISDLKNRD